MEWVLDLTLIGACLLIYYFRREPRQSWVPPIAISCLVVAGIVAFLEVGHMRRVARPPEKPLPKSEEVRASFESSAVTATSDVGYHGAGFGIKIPEGFRYAKLQDPMMLVASRGDGASGIVILRHDIGTDEPEPLVRKSLDLMKKGNATYEFSPLTVEPSQEMRTWFRVTKNGRRLRGLLCFALRNEMLWQLTLTEPATEPDATIYRIAQTWTVD